MLMLTNGDDNGDDSDLVTVPGVTTGNDGAQCEDGGVVKSVHVDQLADKLARFLRLMVKLTNMELADKLTRFLILMVKLTNIELAGFMASIPNRSKTSWSIS